MFVISGPNVFRKRNVLRSVFLLLSRFPQDWLVVDRRGEGPAGARKECWLSDAVHSAWQNVEAAGHLDAKLLRSSGRTESRPVELQADWLILAEASRRRGFQKWCLRNIAEAAQDHKHWRHSEGLVWFDKADNSACMGRQVCYWKTHCAPTQLCSEEGVGGHRGRFQEWQPKGGNERVRRLWRKYKGKYFGLFAGLSGSNRFLVISVFSLHGSFDCMASRTCSWVLVSKSIQVKSVPSPPPP